MKTQLRTTVTLIIVSEEWFDDASMRRVVRPGPPEASMCSRELIHPADIRVPSDQNIQVVRHGRSSEVSRAIVIWDKVGGGLGLSKAVGRQPGPLHPGVCWRSPGSRASCSEQERLLREDTAGDARTGGARWHGPPHPGSRAHPRHHRVRQYDLPQPAGVPRWAGMLRPEPVIVLAVPAGPASAAVTPALLPRTERRRSLTPRSSP